jgi:hypothetical protein
MSKLSFISDSYTIVAGDVAAIFASRGFNVRSGRWETLPGIPLSSSEDRGYSIRSVLIRVRHTGGGEASGILANVYAVADDNQDFSMTRIIQDVISAGRVGGWSGSMPMQRGIVWRITKGGVVAGDLVDIGVNYAHP